MSSEKTREDLVRECVLKANFLRDTDPQKLRQEAINRLNKLQEGLSEGYDPVLLDCEAKLWGNSPDYVLQPLYHLRRK